MDRINKKKWQAREVMNDFLLATNSVRTVARTEGKLLVKIHRAINEECVNCEHKCIDTTKVFDSTTDETVMLMSASCKMKLCKHDIIKPQPLSAESWGYPVGLMSPFKAPPITVREVKVKTINKNFGTW